MLTDPKATSRIIPRLNTPNNEAKNDQIGSKRQTITQTIDTGRRFNKEEQIKCRAAIPRFQCISETMAAKDAEVYGKKATTMGLHSNRQIITNVSGLDRTEQDQLDSNRYMAWIGNFFLNILLCSTNQYKHKQCLGGQLTLQSQAHSAGFMKKRDVANVSYYDKLMNEAAQKLELEQLRENEKERQQNDDEFEENFTLGSAERTIVLPKNDENPIELNDEE
jgi:hypothetical protein